MSILDIRSFVNKQGNTNFLDFCQFVHTKNREHRAEWQLTFFPTQGVNGSWGFSTANPQLWDSVVAGCAYYKQLEVSKD